MKIFKYVVGIVVHPRQTSRELVKEKTAWQGLIFVTGFSLLFAVMFLVGYLKKLYPPDAETLALWIKTWGAFAMLPAIPVPIAQYRLFIAIINVPLGWLMWVTSAGILVGVSRLFKGTLRFKDYLNIVAYGFFTFWLLAYITDGIFSTAIGVQKSAALSGELGLFIQQFVTWFPQIMYPFWFALGAITIGVSVNSTERFAWWKCVIAAILAFMPFPLCVAYLIR